jgi:pimeloyl-ACP methyl ester carboxylesterase
MSRIDLPQGPIAYREFGEGEPLLFVHGILVDGRLWGEVPERLGSQFRCLVPDWPMGSHRLPMNPDADLSPPGIAALITAFLDALELDRVTVVGNDTGGAMSQIFTAAHPDRVERLILTNCDMLDVFPPFPFNFMPPLARVPGGMTVMAAPFRIGAVRRATYGSLVKHPISPELADSWLEPMRADPQVKRDAAKLTAGVNKRHTLEAAERLRSFERPVRFIWAPEDRFFKLAKAEELAAMLPDARIEQVDDAKTFVPLDQPERVAELITGFCR